MIRREVEVFYLDGHDSVVRAVTVSGDGKYLASADEQGTVLVRQIDVLQVNDESRTLKYVVDRDFPTLPITTLATTEAGRHFLVSGNLDPPRIAVVPFESGVERSVLVRTDATIANLFTYNADSMLAYANQRAVTFFDLSAAKVVGSASIYPHKEFGSVRAFAVAPDRRHFALSSSNFVGRYSSAPDRLTIFNTSGDDVYVWQFKTNQDYSRAQLQFTASDTLTVYLPGGVGEPHYSGLPGELRRWRLADGSWHEADNSPGPSGWFHTSTVSLDGKTIYLAGEPVASSFVGDRTWQVVAMSSMTGDLLWKQELRIGVKNSKADFGCRPITALTAVPRSNIVAAGLWDGRVALLRPVSESEDGY